MKDPSSPSVWQGPIYKGSLVMRDNETDMLWSQLLEKCLQGISNPGANWKQFA